MVEGELRPRRVGKIPYRLPRERNHVRLGGIPALGEEHDRRLPTERERVNPRAVLRREPAVARVVRVRLLVVRPRQLVAGRHIDLNRSPAGHVADPAALDSVHRERTPGVGDLVARARPLERERPGGVRRRLQNRALALADRARAQRHAVRVGGHALIYGPLRVAPHLERERLRARSNDLV